LLSRTLSGGSSVSYLQEVTVVTGDDWVRFLVCDSNVNMYLAG
jgi:hypothetical protein